MGTESTVVLLITTIAGILKAFFEWKKAKEEAKRADEMEDMVRLLVDSKQRNALAPEDKKNFVEKLRQTTQIEALCESELEKLMGDMKSKDSTTE